MNLIRKVALKNTKGKKMNSFIQIFFILCWLIFFKDSASYYIPYLVVGICGSVFCYFNTMEKGVYEKNEDTRILLGAAAVFSIMNILANYNMFLKREIPDMAGDIFIFFFRWSYVFAVFSGGFSACWNLLMYLTYKLKNYQIKKVEHRKPAVVVFALSTLLLSTINITVLFAESYPGVLTNDSISSIRQILSDTYNNHHPYYYTRLIGLFVDFGLNQFQDINVSVALYSVFQVIFMASCFSYVIMTMYQMGIAAKWIVSCWVWYAVMPFHIMYSFTMWKDILFGGFVAVFVVSVFRIFKNIGRFHFINYFLLLAGSIGICLFRSNGWFAFLLVFLCFKFLFDEDEGKKRLRYLFFCVLICTFIMKHPVLRYLNVRQPNFLEMIAIPGQQVARIVRDCDDVKEVYKEQLDKIIDIDQLPNVYTSYSFDPIKDLFWETGNYDYLTTHKAEYLVLYLEMSLSHLDTSIKAWIDMTKGYWNGGYSYWIWARNIVRNNTQIQPTVYSERMNQIMGEYLWLYTNVPVLQIFLCIGFHVWIVLGVAVICIIRRDKEALFLMIPVISIVATLLISTPVFSEFRYVYSMFCCIPFLILTPFYMIERNGNTLGKTEE